MNSWHSAFFHALLRCPTAQPAGKRIKQYRRSLKHRFIFSGCHPALISASRRRVPGGQRGDHAARRHTLPLALSSPQYPSPGGNWLRELTVLDHPDRLLRLATDRMAVAVDLAFGAKVTELTDRATGRQWLLTGKRVDDTSDTALYRGDASWGWDECFPTILPCDAPEWGGRLRDHGMVWGRPWRVVRFDPQHLTARFDGYGIHFVRSLDLSGSTLSARYMLTSLRADPVPYMWSQHCVLHVCPSDRLSLSGQGRMAADGVMFDWPKHPRRDLTRIGLPDEGFATKAYALTPTRAMARIGGPEGGLQFEWDGTAVPAIGLWLDYGGWPEEGPLHQVAIEPTSAAADDLARALALGQARWLAPRETHDWSVRLTLLDPEEGQSQ
jgi:hypothetical protein